MLISFGNVNHHIFHTNFLKYLSLFIFEPIHCSCTGTRENLYFFNYFRASLYTMSFMKVKANNLHLLKSNDCDEAIELK